MVTEERRKYQYEYNKKRRKRLVKEHKCIACGCDVKPVVIYHTRCKKHLAKMRNKKNINMINNIQNGERR